jgi:hypothetical protein
MSIFVAFIRVFSVSFIEVAKEPSAILYANQTSTSGVGHQIGTLIPAVARLRIDADRKFSQN